MAPLLYGPRALRVSTPFSPWAPITIWQLTRACRGDAIEIDGETLRGAGIEAKVAERCYDRAAVLLLNWTGRRLASSWRGPERQTAKVGLQSLIKRAPGLRVRMVLQDYDDPSAELTSLADLVEPELWEYAPFPQWAELAPSKLLARDFPDWPQCGSLAQLLAEDRRCLEARVAASGLALTFPLAALDRSLSSGP